MAMVANDPAAAKRVGIPQKVGKEFVAADKGKKFRSSGNAGINLPKTHHGKSALFSKGGEIMATQKKVATTSMGKVKTAAPSRDGVAMKGKTKGTQVKMAGSGVPKGIGSKVMKKGGKVC
jgi:hypothetical protein